ncbi:MAG: hypothetical protein ACK5M7_02065 [Draconibacterium sp.]
MKAINLVGLLVVGVVLLSSCKKDDNGTPQQVTKTYVYTESIRGSQDISGTMSNLSPVTLSAIIGTDPANNFKSGEMQVANCYLEIDGLGNLSVPEGSEVVLQDFTIQVGSNAAVNLGDCKITPQGQNEFASDTPQSTSSFIKVITNIFDGVTSGSKSASLVVSFTPNVDIATSDNVKLKIAIGGTYHYVVHE